MNSAALSELTDLVNGELEAMQGLLDLAHRKTAALVSADLDLLQTVTRGEQALVWSLGRLEERRHRVQVRLEHELGLVAGDLTLARLAELVPSDVAERYTAVHSELARQADALTQQGDANQELIQQALQQVEFSLRVLGREERTAPAYAPDGGRTPGSLARRLDRRG